MPVTLSFTLRSPFVGALDVMSIVSVIDPGKAGVKVTVLKSRAAPRQMMRCKGSKGFVSGGYKPTSVVAQTIGV